jgi:hypothetical protein
MPPWHADPAYGKFSNERRLTAAQKETIAKWVAAGAPEGDAKDLPAAPKYADGWRIGQPDAVLSMQEDYPIPATQPARSRTSTSRCRRTTARIAGFRRGS